MLSSGSEALKKRLTIPRPIQMLILNLTPDSFSDGGKWQDPQRAVDFCLESIELGAEIIDVGGASSRPGSLPTNIAEEWKRLIEFLPLLKKHLPSNIFISVDSYHPQIQFLLAKLELVNIINDIHAGTVEVAWPLHLDFFKNNIELSKELPPFFSRGEVSIVTTGHVAAAFDLPLVLMHMQNNPSNMQSSPNYINVQDEVEEFFKSRTLWAKELGVPLVLLDPGIGFGKSTYHNERLLQDSFISRMQALCAGIVVGVSRKRFLSEIEFQKTGVSIDRPEDRDKVTQILEQSLINFGVQIIRTHKIKKFD